MTEEQHDLIVRLRERMRSLISLYEKTKSDKELLVKENDELKNKLAIKEKDYDILDKKYNTLKLAKVITGDDGESHEAKVKVNKIVREIDKCIALLNN